ncbi:MAG TPA: glycerol-3-phosphate 1-O-acyltransferase PlsY [Clostridiales bacterium]|nr:glycerol-3-phosphate 1-O-acyltransferase PlsY [Clostridiales bacterium]
MENWLRILLAIVAAYALGSLSFSIMITKKVTKNADIRKMGSGNAGFTNVLRSVGKGPAIATIILDFLKGVAAVFIGGLIFSSIFAVNTQQQLEFITYGKYLGGIFCILGHMYPVFFGFKGGKGVVTTAALMAVVDWRVFLCTLGVFLVVFLISKIISLSSLAGAVAYPIITFCFVYFIDYVPSQAAAVPVSMLFVILSTAFAFGIGLVVIVKHRANIKRIINGTEKKITAKK